MGVPRHSLVIGALGAVLAGAGGCRQILGIHDRDIDAGTGSGSDAAKNDAKTIDGPSDVDTDGDGVLDSHDNCPLVKNSGQENEDGDKFGDVCDNCPGDADDVATDTDDDGVGDICDPHPSTGGDKIVLFEGFHEAIPASWTKVGTWGHDGDSANVTSGTDVVSTLTFPDPATQAHEYIVTRLVVGTIFTGGASGQSTGPVVMFNSSGGSGFACAVGQPAGSSPELDLRQSGVSLLASSSYPFEATQVARVMIDRTGTAYGCQAVDPTTTNTPVEITATSSFTNTSPEVGVRARSVSVQFNWIMVIDSP